MDMSLVLVAGVVVMAMSLVGVFFIGRRAEAWLGARLSYLVAFSAGVFLVTGGAMALEVLHIFEAAALFGVLLIALGYLGGWLVEYLLPESHHHHDPHDHGHRHGKASAKKIIIGDAIHNVGDGIMLVAAFTAAPALGIAVTVSVLIHEALQEMSEFFVLRQAGYTTKRALTINFLVSSTMFVGIGVGYLAVTTHALEGVLLALGAGFFLHVVLHDLLPRRHEHAAPYSFVKHVVALVVGVGLMAAVAYTLADQHIHGEYEVHDAHTHDHDHAATELDHDHAGAHAQ